jgi:hypothetical protein
LFYSKQFDFSIESVVEVLVKKGITIDRLSSAGWGQEKPVADNRTEEGRKKNRRLLFYNNFDDTNESGVRIATLSINITFYFFHKKGGIKWLMKRQSNNSDRHTAEN